MNSDEGHTLETYEDHRVIGLAENKLNPRWKFRQNPQLPTDNM